MTIPALFYLPFAWNISFSSFSFFCFFLFCFFIYLFCFKFYFIFKLYIIVLVLPNIKMNPPQVYMCSPSRTHLHPPSPYHPSGLSRCTSPKHPASCIEPGLATRFLHDILHVSLPFSQIFPPSPSQFFHFESVCVFRIETSVLKTPCSSVLIFNPSHHPVPFDLVSSIHLHLR